MIVRLRRASKCNSLPNCIERRWSLWRAKMGILHRRAGMQACGRSRIALIELYEQQVEETRRMNATLERIAAAMERRSWVLSS